MLPVGKLNVQASPVMNHFKTIATLTCLLTLTACGTPGPTLSPDLRGLEERAEQLVAAGELEQAVQAYTQLVNASTGSTQSRFLTEGARVLLDIGNYGSARRWLIRAREAATPALEQQLFVLLAEVEIAEGRPDTALETLALVLQPSSDELVIAVAAVRGRALFGLQRVVEAVSTLVRRELWLNDGAQILDNHRLIWAGLVGQTSGTPFLPTGDPVTDGWLALYPVASASRTNPLGLRQGLLQWRQDYASHPAARTFLLELLAESRLSQGYPTQIAVLLPLSSAQQPVARAIRDGFIAAHLSSSAAATDGTGATLKFYDTSLLGPGEAYLRAQIDGADFVVGPLSQARVGGDNRKRRVRSDSCSELHRK